MIPNHIFLFFKSVRLAKYSAKFSGIVDTHAWTHHGKRSEWCTCVMTWIKSVKQKKRRGGIKVLRSWHGNLRNNGNKIYYCQRWSGYVKTELIRGEDDTLNRFCDISLARHYSVLVLHFSPDLVYPFFRYRAV